MVDENFPVDFFYGKRRTTSDAIFAVETFFFVPKNLQARLLAFGVGAPSAFERTAFEENNSPNAWAVVYAELLNIENHAVFAHKNSSADNFFQIILHGSEIVNKNFTKIIDLLTIS